MGDRAEVRIPLLGKSVKLPLVPGQDPDKTYAVAWGACREPGAGFGYVLELTGKREGRILAWLNAGGSVYACDKPLAYLPKGEPDVLVTQWEDSENAGKVEARLGAGPSLDLVSEYRVSRMGGYSFEDPVVDMGGLGGANLDLRRFLAVAFLAFVHVPAETGAPVFAGATLRDVLAHILALPLPDSLDLLLARVADASEQDRSVSGFERYAAHVLSEAGAASVRPIAVHQPVPLGRLSTTGMFWVGVDPDRADPADAAVLLAVEAALNRLALIEPAFKRSRRAVDRPGHYIAACAREDDALLRTFPALAADLARGYERENPLRMVCGTDARRGGDWDVRTRFAAACESMPLPCRLRYSFDVDVSAGVLAVEFVMPPERSFPRSRWVPGARAWVEDIDASAAAVAYALRLSGLLAAAAFGCGVGIARATVTAYSGETENDAVFSLAFDRLSFVDEALPRISAGALGELALDAPAAELLEVLAPVGRSFDLAPDGSIGLALSALPSGIELERPQLSRDARPLPPELADVLRANKVSDLDVMDARDDMLIGRVREAYQVAGSSPAQAIARLEDVVSAYEVCDDGFAGRLYCSDPVARMLIDLIPADKSARYVKMPDSEFAARSFLSRLYRLVHEPDLALAYARECIEFAPTTSNGYTDAASALVDLDRNAEAYDLLLQALRVTVVPVVIDYIYYRLAYVCWLLGRRNLALACYALVGDGAPVSERAAMEMAELMGEMGTSEPPSRSAARQTLSEAGVPVAPTDEALSLAARVAQALADEGFPRAVAPLASLLGSALGGDVLEVVSRSYARGVKS